MKQREEFAASRPQSDGSNELWLGNNDVAIAHSMYSGAPGDPYFAYYLAHEYAAVPPAKYTTLVYCPVLSGHDLNYNCTGCKEDVKVKERFGMWLYVYSIYHETVKAGTTLPKAIWPVDGRSYYFREVNKPLLWLQSAWKDSPLADIHNLANQLKDLRATRVNIRRVNNDPTGSNFGVRYKFYPEMNTPPIDAALYEKTKTEILPMIDYLRSTLNTVPTVSAPAQAPVSVVQQEAPPDPMPFPATSTSLPPVVAPPPPVTDQNAPPALPPFTIPEDNKALF